MQLPQPGEGGEKGRNWQRVKSELYTGKKSRSSVAQLGKNNANLLQSFLLKMLVAEYF